MLGFTDIVQDSQGVSYSGSTLVKGNPSLSSYTVRNGTKHIAALAFRKAEKLSNIEFPDGLLNIGDASFSSCKSLKHITIPASVESVGVSAFNNSSIEEVVFLGVPGVIETSAFAACEHLEQIVVPQGNKQYFQNILTNQCHLVKEASNEVCPSTKVVTTKPSVKNQENNNPKINIQNMNIEEILATLKDDYALRKNLKRKNLTVHAELDDEINQLESSYIEKQMLAIKDNASAMFDCLECDVCIKITKKADETINVESDNVLHIEPQNEKVDDEIDTVVSSESIGFSVTFPNGKIIQSNNAKNTLIAALKAIGLEKVSRFTRRQFKGYPLVGKKKRDGQEKWQEYVDGWYIYININNYTKKRVLEMISEDYGLGLIVKDETDAAN